MGKPVVNIHDLQLLEAGNDERFQMHVASITAGDGKLGARLVVVPPGKSAWPFHCHHANEEMFIILNGTGTLRFALERHALRAGDVVMCPSGGPETAHQIVNDSTAELRYLAISTMTHPDVAEYPDSNKVGVIAGSPPGGDSATRRLAMFFPAGAAVDYYDGES